MPLRKLCVPVFHLFLLGVWTIASAQSSSLNAIALYATAHRLYVDRDYIGVENYARQALLADPSFTAAHELLAHSLFYQQKYKAAVAAFRRTMDLNAASHAIPLIRLRTAIDNYAMACAMTGSLPFAKSLLRAAISSDPDYPMYYHTLASMYAERGDLENTLVNLRAACERRANMSFGEEFPDPRVDSTFTRYRHNPRFERLLIEVGY